jgi:hypothetical protein
MADLTYNVVEMALTGSIDGHKIEATAFSGGRAGSTHPQFVHPILANNPFLTSVKKVTKGDKTIGGTLPLGIYELKTHENKKQKFIRLNPVAGTPLHGRGGFLIHGRGPRGSDGCIVPEDFHAVLSIYTLVQTRERGKRPAPTLEVVATGDIDVIEARMRNWAHTA